MLYHYQAHKWQPCAQLPETAAIFTTFRSDAHNLTRHWQRLCKQAYQCFGHETALTEAILADCRKNFALDRQVLKVIITAEDQWYLAVRPFEVRQAPLKLEGHCDLERSERARIKDANRQYYWQQLQQSRAQGFDDTIYFDQQGIVLETTIASLFWSDGQRLYKPASELPILAGTFAAQVTDWCQLWGIEIDEVTWTYPELKANARQIWCCNAVIGWQAVGQLDDDWFSQATPWTQALTQKITQQEW